MAYQVSQGDHLCYETADFARPFGQAAWLQPPFPPSPAVTPRPLRNTAFFSPACFSALANSVPAYGCLRCLFLWCAGEECRRKLPACLAALGKMRLNHGCSVYLFGWVGTQCSGTQLPGISVFCGCQGILQLHMTAWRAHSAVLNKKVLMHAAV